MSDEDKIPDRLKKWQKPRVKTGPDGPKFKPINWDTVRVACGMMCSFEEVAALVLVSFDTLERAAVSEFGRTFKDLYAEWSLSGKATLRRKQWALADKSAAMAIFLGKQYLGQQDDYHLRQTGNFHQEIVHYGEKPPKKWSDESGDNKNPAV